MILTVLMSRKCFSGLMNGCEFLPYVQSLIPAHKNVYIFMDVMIQISVINGSPLRYLFVRMDRFLFIKINNFYEWIMFL